jgi:hypothetical protein
MGSRSAEAQSGAGCWGTEMCRHTAEYTPTSIRYRWGERAEGTPPVSRKGRSSAQPQRVIARRRSTTCPPSSCEYYERRPIAQPVGGSRR